MQGVGNYVTLAGEPKPAANSYLTPQFILALSITGIISGLVVEIASRKLSR